MSLRRRLMHPFNRAALKNARLTLVEAPVEQSLGPLRLPYDIAKALREYAAEADKKPETIAIEALRAYLGAM